MLILLLLLPFSVSAGYNCSGQRLINPPLDLNEPYYYPEDWNENQAPAEYVGSQSCEWRINMLEGMYATVVFFKDTDSESGINCVYPNSEQEYIEDKDHNPYVFTYPQFTVNLRVADKTGRFSFKVLWQNLPATSQMNVQLDENQPMSTAPSPFAITYTAPNNVIFFGFSLQDDRYPLLRQSAVFEGNSTGGRYLGNLNSARYSQIKSDGQQLTVYTFGLSEKFNYTLMAAMDTKAAGNVKRFSGLNCPEDPSNSCNLVVNSVEEVSAVITVSNKNTDYLKQIFEFPTDSTLSIYEGRISEDLLIAKIDHSNYLNQLPFAIKNTMKIYVLDKGRISFPVTKNAADADWSTVYDGRIVNIHSFDYKTISHNQDTSEAFETTGNEKLNFNFKVNQCDFVGETYLNIKVLNDGNIVFSENYNYSSHPPKTIQKIYGNKFLVNYQTVRNPTTGFQMDFTTTRNGTPSVETTSTASTQIVSKTTTLPIISSTTKNSGTETSRRTTASGVETTTSGSCTLRNLLFLSVFIFIFNYLI